MIGLTVMSEFAMQQCRSQQLRDVVRQFNSDILFTPSRIHEPFLKSQLDESVTIATQPLQPELAVEIASTDDVKLVWVSTPDALEQFVESSVADCDDNLPEAYLMSDQLSVSVDLINLEACLEGLSAYRDPLVENDALGNFTHLSIEANPEYRTKWQGVDVQGIMPRASEQQGTTQAGIAHFELQGSGESLDSISFDR